MKREEVYSIYRERQKDISKNVLEEKSLEYFEKAIPKECKKCTLLEKDKYRKKAKCIYRTKEGCMLYGIYSR